MHTPEPSGPDAEPSSLFGRHQFLIIRLFSLTGLLPVGGYLCLHLLTNATILDSPQMFQEKVDQIHSLRSLLPVVEWVFIFLPILFHAGVGWLIVAGAVPNTNAYPYASNIRYTLQRGTGIVAFFFILLHLMHMHHYGSVFAWLGGGQFQPHEASSSAGQAIQAALLVQIVYAVGVVACVYHLANGIWTFGIRWGIWISPAAQRRASVACLGFGLLLGAAGLGSLVGMSRVDVDSAREFERRHHEAVKLLSGEELQQQSAATAGQ